MALVICPDCGHEISDAAPACIHCGRPAEKADEELGAVRSRTHWSDRQKAIAILSCIGLLGWFWFGGDGRGRAPDGVPGSIGASAAYLEDMDVLATRCSEAKSEIPSIVADAQAALARHGQATTNDEIISGLITAIPPSVAPQSCRTVTDFIVGQLVGPRG